jgi:anti-anti-sigma regulatory factor
VKEEHRPRLLLNMGNVDRLSTAMLGKFMAAHRRAAAATGQLAFCGIVPSIYQVFEMLRLTHVFNIYDDEQKGLEALAR